MDKNGPGFARIVSKKREWPYQEEYACTLLKNNEKDGQWSSSKKGSKIIFQTTLR